MIVRNGICHADASAPRLKITAAENIGDHLVMVSFNDGAKRVFDGRSLAGEVFAPLANPKVFASWTLDYETLTWNDGDIDIAPEYVFSHSANADAAS